MFTIITQRAADDTNHDSTQPVPIPKKSQTVQIDHNLGQFLDYLEDFEDVDVRQPVIVEPNVQVEEVQPDGQINQQLPVVPQIDQRWVTVDQSNIIEGTRTRGNRPDYRGLASGSG